MRFLRRIPIHPVLFAAYAVLFLYAANLTEVLPVDAAAPLVRAVLGAALAWAVFSLLFRDVRRGAIVATALVIAFFAYGHVAPGWPSVAWATRSSSPPGRLLVLGAIVFAARARDRLPTVTAGLNVAAIVLLVLVAATIVPYEAGRAGRPSVSLAPAAVAARPVTGRKPDIYFLIFDRYGSADAIKRRFGITDNDLYQWLRDRGFQVPEHSHANYRATDFSLAATLNMRYLDDLTTTIGRVAETGRPRRR